jgi:flagellar basal-body rod protein FlgB
MSERTRFANDARGGLETTPLGNAVVLEDEMLKVAQTQMDHQAATALYSRGLGLLKTALGRR